MEKPKKIIINTNEVLYSDPVLYSCCIDNTNITLNIYQIRKLMQKYFNDKNVEIIFPDINSDIPSYYLDD